eukprot:11505483-Prorocentrum_lima.AAC.1
MVTVADSELEVRSALLLSGVPAGSTFVPSVVCVGVAFLPSLPRLALLFLPPSGQTPELLIQGWPYFR